MATVASKVPFSELSGLLERISHKSGLEQKKALLKEFIEHWRTVHKKAHGEKETVRVHVTL